MVFFSGSHKDISEKFREILDNILKLGEDELVEGLKAVLRNRSTEIRIRIRSV